MSEPQHFFYKFDHSVFPYFNTFSILKMQGFVAPSDLNILGLD